MSLTGFRTDKGEVNRGEDVEIQGCGALEHEPSSRNLLAVWSWINSLTPLCFSFLIYKTRAIIVCTWQDF